MLATRHDDDDDIYIYIYINILEIHLLRGHSVTKVDIQNQSLLNVYWFHP